MTVTYTREVATSRGFSCFLKLLARWKGSIYKLVYAELIVFLILFYGLQLIYIYILGEFGKENFRDLVNYCRSNTTLIPLSFVLGFYVTIVMTRWWNQYCSIPFPDSLAVYVSATIHGQDERGRIMRRSIMRYACLCVTMLFTNISGKVKKRFPTFKHLVAAGLLDENEMEIIEALNRKQPKYSKHWMPLVWAASIVTRARKEGRIRDDFAVKTMLDEINKFRGYCGVLITYDYISIPLVYTQVVTLAVYSYFLATLMGHQMIDDDTRSRFGFYFPFFTLLQFFFYMGWLKVAETMINPFGEDDDDFDLNWMVDRNVQISYLIVDEMHHEHPELIKDQYWDEVMPDQLPYTAETEPLSRLYPVPSTANIFAQCSDNKSIFGSKSKLSDSRLSLNKNSKSRRASLINNVKRILLRTENAEDDFKKIPESLIGEVIEEVEEHLTMIAKREEPKKPLIYDIFNENNIPQTDNINKNSKENQFNDEEEKEDLIKIKDNLAKYLNKK